MSSWRPDALTVFLVRHARLEGEEGGARLAQRPRHLDRDAIVYAPDPALGKRPVAATQADELVRARVEHQRVADLEREHLLQRQAGFVEHGVDAHLGLPELGR